MEKQHLEDKELENILEKLEALDIREWNYDDDYLTVEKHDLKFRLRWDRLRIQNTDKQPYNRIYEYYDKKKQLRKVFEGFYTRIYYRLIEHQKKELEEKLGGFLLE